MAYSTTIRRQQQQEIPPLPGLHVNPIVSPHQQHAINNYYNQQRQFEAVSSSPPPLPLPSPSHTYDLGFQRSAVISQPIYEEDSKEDGGVVHIDSARMIPPEYLETTLRLYREDTLPKIEDHDQWKYIDPEDKDCTILFNDYYYSQSYSNQDDGFKQERTKNGKAIDIIYTKKEAADKFDRLPWYEALEHKKNWICHFPGEIRDLKKTPVQFTTLHFHLPNGFYMPVEDFVSLLIMTQGQLKLTIDTSVLQAGFRHEYDPPDKKVLRCAIVNGIWITEEKSNLLELFDVNLYSASYDTPFSGVVQPQPGMTSPQHQQPPPLSTIPLISWLQPSGPNMEANQSVATSNPLCYHTVIPGTDNNNIRCLFMNQMKVLNSPLFNRWIQADIESLKKEMKGCLKEDGYYVFKAPSKAEIHPESLLNFIAVTEYQRMRKEAKTKGNDIDEVCIEEPVTSAPEIKGFKIHKNYLDPIVAEKHTGPLDRKKHLLRLDHPIHLILTLKDRKTVNVNDVIKRITEKANRDKINYVYTSHKIMIGWDSFNGLTPTGLI